MGLAGNRLGSYLCVRVGVGNREVLLVTSDTRVAQMSPIYMANMCTHGPGLVTAWPQLIQINVQACSSLCEVTQESVVSSSTIIVLCF